MLGRALMFIGMAAAKFLVALLPLLFIFQTLSRANAYAKIEDAKKLPEVGNQLMEQGQVWVNMFKMWFDAIFGWSDSLAKTMSKFLTWSYWIEKTMGLVQGITAVFVMLNAILAGFIWSLIGAFEDIKAFRFAGMGDRMVENFKGGYNNTYDKLLSMREEDEKERFVSKRITNIAKIEINNAFKEQQEPDRIAFTLKEQIVKAATNPRSARGRSLSNGMTAF